MELTIRTIGYSYHLFFVVHKSSIQHREVEKDIFPCRSRQIQEP
ncbi:hypothetical protein MTAT_27380 [Moorella thermoacetica]|uniref:Uncharacterized protein n=1 Tax=Neomoorella thermoacetica TaxID=1525 RepID=A0AAC9HFJ0_NEOTH|nr:hypothetical protein Maut_00318 [Moorella thermoacetica]TYL08308.1 hypothetical protein MTAT_27380 [Moorella thermoacetica]